MALKKILLLDCDRIGWFYNTIKLSLGTSQVITENLHTRKITDLVIHHISGKYLDDYQTSFWISFSLMQVLSQVKSCPDRGNILIQLTI